MYYIRCVDLRHVAISTARHLVLAALPCFFRSTQEVRACCDSAVDFTDKKVVSVVVIFQIEVACDFYVPKQRISASCGVCRLLGCSRRAPFDALRLLASPRGIKLSLRTCRSNSMSFHFTQTFPT